MTTPHSTPSKHTDSGLPFTSQATTNTSPHSQPSPSDPTTTTALPPSIQPVIAPPDEQNQQPLSDDVSNTLPLLHSRYLELQSSSTRRIGPAMAFFEPFFQRSETLSFVRCTVCVPQLPPQLEASVKSQLSKPARSNTGTAIHRAKVSRIRGFVARSSKTATGGTSSLFNHAQRSHPALLAALRSMIERDVSNKRENLLVHNRVAKRRRSSAGSVSNITPTKSPQQHQPSFQFQSTIPIRSHHLQQQQINLQQSSSQQVLRRQSSTLSSLKLQHILTAAATTKTLTPSSTYPSAVTLSTTGLNSWSKYLFIQPLPPSQLRSLWSTLRQSLAQYLQSSFEKPISFALSLDPWYVAGASTPHTAMRLHYVTPRNSCSPLSTINSIHVALLQPHYPIDTALETLKLQLPHRIIAIVAKEASQIPFLSNKLCEEVTSPFRSICLVSAVASAATSLFYKQNSNNLLDANYSILKVPSLSKVITNEDHQDVNSVSPNHSLTQYHHTASPHNQDAHLPDDSFVEATVTTMAHCIASMHQSPSVSPIPFVQSSATSQTPITTIDNVTATEGDITLPSPQSNELGDTTRTVDATISDVVQDVDNSTNALVDSEHDPYQNPSVQNPSSIPAVPTPPLGHDGSICQTTSNPDNSDHPTSLPRPWIKNNFLSLLHEWETLAELDKEINESPFQSSVSHILSKISNQHWVVVHALTKVLSIVREHLAVQEGWCMLSDSLISIINLVCAICDRVSQIEGFMGQKLPASSSFHHFGKYLRQYYHLHVNTQGNNDEDHLFELGSEEFSTSLKNDDYKKASVMILEGLFLTTLLRNLYPLIQPFTEYLPEQAHYLIAIALDPRYSSLASLISLYKKLNQGSRLMFDKQYQGPTEPDDRIRKRVLTTLVEYDNKIIIPMMMSAITKTSSGQESGITSKLAQEAEEGLFVETFVPTEDWKLRRHLESELNQFRSYKKNILRTASSAEALQWWDDNGEIFPNIATLYRKIICIPSSHVPTERILRSAGAKVFLSRRQLGRTGLDDFVFLHENLNYTHLADMYPELNLKLNDEPEHSPNLFDDDTLYDLAPNLFSS